MITRRLIEIEHELAKIERELAKIDNMRRELIAERLRKKLAAQAALAIPSDDDEDA